MEENGYAPLMPLAQVSKVVGVIFCVAGIVTGIALTGGSPVKGALFFVSWVSTVVPTLAGGFLLIVAGRILQVVSVSSNVQTEPVRKED